MQFMHQFSGTWEISSMFNCKVIGVMRLLWEREIEEIIKTTGVFGRANCEGVEALMDKIKAG